MELVGIEEQWDDFGPVKAWKLRGPLWLPAPVPMAGKASLFYADLLDEQLPEGVRGR